MILVMDDEPTLTAILDELLNGLGLVHEISNSIDDAFRRVSEHGEKISIALIDLRIDDKPDGGLQLVNLIHGLADPTKAYVPIVLMTGNELYEEISKQAADSHISGFLSKPFMLDALEETLNHYARFPLETFKEVTNSDKSKDEVTANDDEENDDNDDLLEEGKK